MVHTPIICHSQWYIYVCSALGSRQSKSNKTNRLINTWRQLTWCFEIIPHLLVDIVCSWYQLVGASIVCQGWQSWVYPPCNVIGAWQTALFILDVACTAVRKWSICVSCRNSAVLVAFFFFSFEVGYARRSLYGVMERGIYVIWLSFGAGKCLYSE